MIKLVMTYKQKNMIKERLKDPAASNAEIIRRSGYNVQKTGKNPSSVASNIYLENMKVPEIRNRLEAVTDEIEEVLIKNVRQFSMSRTPWKRQMSNENAKWIHDKAKGKAVTTSVNTNLNINLEQALNDLL